jgi:hypothetical protein
MRLGSIVDCFAAAEDAPAVAQAAAAFLEHRGVDLIVSNQAHSAWCNALKNAGFLQGPSNFIFASSPKLSRLLANRNIGNGDIHINRGDGDGPDNL